MGDSNQPPAERSNSRCTSLVRNSSSRRHSAVEVVKVMPKSPPKPLDGRWGWMIVFGASLGHFLLVGLARTLGVFFVAWVEKFEGSAAATAWVQSLFNTVRMVIGPFVSMLCDTYGSRWVVMIGGVLLCAGCIASAFANSLMHLYFTFSVLGGIGGGLIFTPMFVMVNQYFDKKKGIAMSLATVGSGLGTLVLAPLETLLLGNYGNYGAMLVIAGIMLNCTVVGALFRPLDSKLNATKEQLVVKKMKIIIGEEEDSENVELNERGCATEDLNIHEDSEKDTAEIQETEPLTSRNDIEDAEKEKASRNVESDVVLEAADANRDKLTLVTPPKTALQKSPSQVSQTSMDRKSLMKRNPSHSASLRKVPSTVSHNRMDFFKPEKKLTKMEQFKTRFAILKNLTFWIYCVYISALPCAVQIYLIYTPSLMKERGFSEGQRALVLSIAGGSDIAGRFISGFLFDLNFIRSRRWPTHCCYSIVLGVIILCNGIQHHLVGFISMALLWGIFEGGYHSQRATIVSEFITREQVASSVGFMIFWQGIGNMISPTFAGFLRDKTGTYSVSFYYGGSAMILCAILFLGNFIVVYARKKKTQVKKQKKSASNKA